MATINKEEILLRAKHWFKSSVIDRHLTNTRKLSKLSKFNVNPFLINYLAYFLDGSDGARSIARALVYGRALSTSINTTFGSAIQRFTTDVLGSLGSSTSGIDIEFIDHLDGRKKYCQLKAGPNTINRDDVETISRHFGGIRKLAKQNGLQLQLSDLVVGVVYGTRSELSSHYSRIENELFFPVIVGQDLWFRLTGDEDFYSDLIAAIGDVVEETDFSSALNDIIEKLADTEELKSLAKKSA